MTAETTPRRSWLLLALGAVVGALLAVLILLALGFRPGTDAADPVSGGTPTAGAGDEVLAAFEPVEIEGVLIRSIRVATRGDEDQSVEGASRTAFELGENLRVWVAYDANGSDAPITIAWEIGGASDEVTQAASDDGLFVFTLGTRATDAAGNGTIRVTVGDQVVSEIPFAVSSG